MDKFTVTAGQLVLSSPPDVYDQIDRTFAENPEAELFVFPEFSTQHAVDLKAVPYLQENEAARKAALKWLNLVPDFSAVKALSDRFGKAILIGAIAQEDQQLFSRAYFYDPQRRQQASYDKTHVHWTEDFLKPGSTLEPIETRFGKIGILICYDMAFAEPARVLSIQGVELLCALSAIPVHFHWRYAHHRMIGAAIFNQVYVVAAHLGHAPEAPMGGHSGIYDPRGDLITQIGGAGSGYTSADIDLGQVKRWREEERINPYRRPRLYEAITAPVDSLQSESDSET